MITENDVLLKLKMHLESNNYSVTQCLNTKQKGCDLIAEKPNEILVVEAKGETSARNGSARYGKPFNSSQVRVHVAEAVYTTLQALDQRTDKPIVPAIALPSTSLHRKEISKVEFVLKRLGVKIFFVSEGNVEVV